MTYVVNEHRSRTARMADAEVPWKLMALTGQMHVRGHLSEHIHRTPRTAESISTRTLSSRFLIYSFTLGALLQPPTRTRHSASSASARSRVPPRRYLRHPNNLQSFRSLDARPVLVSSSPPFDYVQQVVSRYFQARYVHLRKLRTIVTTSSTAINGR